MRTSVRLFAHRDEGELLFAQPESKNRWMYTIDNIHICCLSFPPHMTINFKSRRLDEAVAPRRSEGKAGGCQCSDFAPQIASPAQ